MPTTIIKLPEPPAAPRSLTQKALHFLVRLVLCWLPKGSPNYYWNDDVAYWFVEVEDGRAEREIGFNAQGEPILHAPTDRNMGLWTDADREFVVDEFEAVAAAEFERFWAVVSQASPPTPPPSLPAAGHPRRLA